MKTKHTIVIRPGEYTPRHISPGTKRIINCLGRYHRALETKDFIYFVNFQEGDENGCVMMYRKKEMELASDNYFAYGSMFELLTEQEKEITYISRSMRYNLKLHKEAELAVKQSNV